MLLRQLQRPLARYVTAQAWQASYRAWLHGSTSLPQRSLFDQLFPDESKQLPPEPSAEKASEPDSTVNEGETLEARKKWASQVLGHEKEILSMKNDDVSDTILKADEAAAMLPDGGLGLEDVMVRAQSMLVLSSASKNLVESDFFRLGTKGRHLDGWVSGILKVIPARNPDTLEPLGQYFILFDRRIAAAAYSEEIVRLWSMGKQYAPGANFGRLSQNLSRPFPPPPGLTPGDNNVIASLRCFTLVPPAQRYSLDHSPIGPDRVEALHRGPGGFADALARRAGSRHLVLVSLDGGLRVSAATLRRAIEDDGADRNLPWRVTDLQGGILAFGKSVLKSYDREDPPAAPEEESEGNDDAGDVDYDAEGPIGSLDLGGEEKEKGDEEGRSEASKAEAEAEAEAEGSSTSSPNTSNEFHRQPPPESVDAASKADPERAAADKDNELRQYPRFLIPFADEAEARRFVRSWHRRELHLKMTNPTSWREPWNESRIVNASILW